MARKPLLTLLVAVLLTTASVEAADRYGGDRSVQLKGTGFFRLGTTEGRHFLVTPDGHPFRALGLNHYHMMTSKDYDKALASLRGWGFNAGGYHPPQWQWARIPHTRGLFLTPTSIWMQPGKFAFKDVFDEAYLRDLHKRIRRVVEPAKDNPYMIGYFWTDVPTWGRKRTPRWMKRGPYWGQGWVSFCRSLPEQAPGRKAWEQWRKANGDAPETAFLAVIAKHLYSHAHAYVRKYDKNHLIFGDRYWEFDMPEQVIREALPFIDALAIQPQSKEFDPAFHTKLARRYGKAVYIADHVSSYRTDKHPNTMSQVTKDAKSYIAYYTRYVTAALSHPFVIGYNKCQYQDELLSPTYLKQGLLRADGTPRPTVDGVRAANLKALKAAYSKESSPKK